MIFNINYPSEILGSRSRKGVYGKEPLSCDDLIDENILN